MGATLVHLVGRRTGTQLTGSLPEVSAAISLGIGSGTGLLLIRKLAEGSFTSLWIAGIGGCLLGAATGIAIGLAATQDGPMLAVLRRPSMRDMRAGLGAGLALAITAISAVHPGRAVALGAILGLGFALAVGLTRPATTPGDNMGPRESYDADKRGSFWFGAIGGAATAAGGLVVAPVGGLFDSTVASAALAGAAVCIAGAVTASQAVAVISIGALLRLRGRTPFRLMAFLEFARERDLLRCAGSAFEFRHKELQEYLTHDRTGSESVPESAGSTDIATLVPP